MLTDYESQISWSQKSLKMFKTNKVVKLKQWNHKTGWNEGKSDANFMHQVATWFPDMFCNFYLVKIPKIANNSTTTEAKEKIKTDLESLEL